MSEPLSDALIAEHHAYQRPGFRLICYRRVIRPLFRLTLRVLTIQKKAIPPIQEYILKSVDAGLVTAEEVAAFLGLERGVVDTGLWELQESGDVFVSAPPGMLSHRLMVTDRGYQTLKDLFHAVTEEREIPVIIDGLTHRIVTDYRDEDLLKAQELRDLSLPELAAYPRRYKPTVEDIESGFSAFFERYQRGMRGARRDVLDIVDIDHFDRRFRSDAHVLVYYSEQDATIETDLAIEGRVSEAHAEAFRHGEQASELGLLPTRLQTADALFASAIGQDALAMMAPQEQTSIIRGQVDAAMETEARLRDRLPRASQHERAQLEGQIREIEAKRDDLQASLDGHPARWLEVFEQPRYLHKALQEAQNRLLILSPRIRREIVNDTFLMLLKEALNRNVQVYIGYGYADREDRTSDANTIKQLERLRHTKQCLHISKIAAAHVNALVCDQVFAIATAFPWLSLQADPREAFRDERGMLVRIPALVDRCFTDNVALFP